MENPIDIARCDDAGFYIAEQHADRVDYVADGQLTYTAGLGGYPGLSGDGGPALQALMSEPTGLACGPDGEIYVSDSLNHVIRVVYADGTIDTFAGDGEFGLVDGVGVAARMSQPMRLAVHDGALYVVDWLNSAIRRISIPDRTVTTVVGNGTPGFSGDGGPATLAQLHYPNGIGFGPDGAMYIADTENHVIRKVDTDGIISTVAGTPCGPDIDETTGTPMAHPGFAGDGGPALDALLNAPQDVVVDDQGTMWIADTFNSRIRSVKLE
jgi:sugar lactone lactonase YvrE